MRKFLLLLLGVTFLCVNNSNAQNNNPQGGQQQIEFRILKGGHHSSGTSGEHHAPYMRPYIMGIYSEGILSIDTTILTESVIGVEIINEDGDIIVNGNYVNTGEINIPLTNLSSNVYTIVVTDGEDYYESEFEIE